MKIISFLQVAILGGVLISPPSFAQTKSPQDLMRVISHELVSKKRVGRSAFEYEYKITAENNTDTDYSGVFAIASVDSDSVEIVDGDAQIGALNAFSQTKATDTIKVRVDRRTPFNPAKLDYVFDNDSLEGIDANENGIRDPLETFILNKDAFSAETRVLMFSLALEYSKIFKGIISDEAAQNVIKKIGLLSQCLDLENNSFQEFHYKFSAHALSSDARLEAYDEFSKNVGLVEEEFLSDDELKSLCMAEIR